MVHMRGTPIDWTIPPNDSVGSDLWLPAAYQVSRTDEPGVDYSSVVHQYGIQSISHPSGHVARSDGILFADQLRRLAYEIISGSQSPLSNHQIRAAMIPINNELVALLDQRKSTSCMSKILMEDGLHRFVRYRHFEVKKPSSFYGISGRSYDPEVWIKKTNDKSPEKSHRSDIETAEKFRELIKVILLQKDNKPMTCFEISNVIKEENVEMYSVLAAKNRNYLIKTLKRDPKKRFGTVKVDAGTVAFNLCNQNL